MIFPGFRSVAFDVVAIAAMSLWAASAATQELVPRAFWPAPKGTELLVFGYQYSTGDVTSDATLPISGQSNISFAQVSYLRTLGLFDRTANIQFTLPYTWGTTDGTVDGQFVSRDYSSFADASVRFSINLFGAPSMDRAGFAALRADPRPIVGASILIQAPTGGYETDRLINAGSNRWMYKLTTGVIWPLRPKWLLEADFGVKFFGDNDAFVGMTRKQDPIYSGEIHLIKRITPGFWASVDLTYYEGGQTTVGQLQRGDSQESSRAGATLVFPFKRQYAIRAQYTTGIGSGSGGNYDTFGLSYLYVW